MPKPISVNKGKSKPLLKPTLDGPTHAHLLSNPTAQKNEPLFKDAIFAPEVYVRENNMRTTFTPSCVRLTQISEQVWQELTADNNQIDKQMLPQGLRYYSGLLLWLRIASLKRSNNLPLSDNEVRLLSLFDDVKLNVPEPLFLYLRALGTVEQAGTGQVLIPEFPTLPEAQVAGFGGFFGELDADTHILYEEFPALGVLAESLRVSLSDAPPGDYASVLALEGLNVNENLCGYRPLANRRAEAKNPFLNMGITADVMPESIPGTAISFAVIQMISTWLSKSSTFKLQQVDFTRSEMMGSNAQTVLERPIVEELQPNVRLTSSQLYTSSLDKASPNTFGVALYGLFQLYKEARGGQGNLSVRSRTWCCVDFTGIDADTTIPDVWIINRNARRNLPVEYASNRFSTISQNSGDLLIRTVARMVIEKR